MGAGREATRLGGKDSLAVDVLDYDDGAADRDRNGVTGGGAALHLALLDKIRVHWTRVRDAFKRMDADSDGSVSKSEFAQFLRLQNVPHSPADVDELFAALDADGSGTVRYNEFVAMLDGATVSTSMISNAVYAHDEKTRGSVKILWRKLQSFYRTKWKTMREAFFKFDEDHDGTVDFAEAKQCLIRLNLGATDSEIDALLREVDTDSSGTIKYNEFMLKFREPDKYGEEYNPFLDRSYKTFYDTSGDARGPGRGRVPALLLPGSSAAGASSVKRSVLDRVRVHFASPSAAWRYFDDNKDGAVSNDEFVAQLGRLDLPHTRAELQQFVEAFDHANHGYVTFPDFMAIFEPSYTKPMSTRPDWLADGGRGAVRTTLAAPPAAARPWTSSSWGDWGASPRTPGTARGAPPGPGFSPRSRPTTRHGSNVSYALNTRLTTVPAEGAPAHAARPGGTEASCAYAPPLAAPSLASPRRAHGGVVRPGGVRLSQYVVGVEQDAARSARDEAHRGLSQRRSQLQQRVVHAYRQEDERNELREAKRREAFATLRGRYQALHPTEVAAILHPADDDYQPLRSP